MQQRPQQSWSLFESDATQPPDPQQPPATPWGAHFVRTNAQVVAELPMVTSVSLANLCEVHSHEVLRTAGLVSHSVRFMDGGHLRFAYNTCGELVELHCRGVSVAMTPDGCVMAGMPGSPPLQEFAERTALVAPMAGSGGCPH
ncbi:hypothetical protein [Azohydromonas lata]|uniref:hypothetical protein n=1 Tax=Azohydromonas lata TaxID=45677 RepID=UPI00082F905A|nr:hypothetical protein [Azohydromonas lata]